MQPFCSRAHLSRLDLVIHVLLGVLLLAPTAGKASEDDLKTVPFPDISHLEARVAAQIREMESMWRPVMENPNASVIEKTEAYGELGMLYHAYQLEAPARVCYQNAERLAPHEFRWPYLRGVLEQQAGRLEQADHDYQRALERQPTWVPALIRLAQIRLAQNRLTEAETLLQKALQKSPNSAAALAARGEVALAGRRFKDAVTYLNSALRAAPSANRLHYPLSIAYRGLGELELAKQHLAQRGEVGVKPTDPLVDGLSERLRGERIHLLRGQRAFRAGRYPEAVQAFTKAVEAEPESARARINLGSALALNGDRKRAVTELETALRLAPKNVTAHYNLGRLLALNGDLHGAIDHLRTVAALRPGDHQALLELARVLRRAGKLDEALTRFSQVIDLAPLNGTARFEEAVVLVEAGRYASARQKLEKAHQLIPDDERLAHGLARLLAGSPDLEQRDGARALLLAQRVFKSQVAPDHAATVAMALAEVGRCDEAVEWQRRALSMGSQSESVAWLSDLVRILRRYEQDRPCRYPVRATAAPPELSNSSQNPSQLHQTGSIKPVVPSHSTPENQ